MRRVPRTLAAVLAVALWLLAATAMPARAEDADVVRSLDVTYDVQANGTVDVRYRLDWDFGKTGSHGIKLTLVTAEPWDDDPLKEAVYEIRDLAVTSPTGVPTDVDARDNEYSGTRELRIGDPDTTLNVSRATYEVSYTLAGALRTFDGKPQLHWDVTSRDFPAIDAFTITVTGPADVPRARCLQGRTECASEVAGHRATLRGQQVAASQPITAVTEFEAGSVKNAKPRLRDRDLRNPALLATDATITVGADGSALVEERLRVQPSRRDSEISWEIPERRSLTWNRDQLLTVSDFRLTLSNGTPVRTTRTVQAEGGDRQRALIAADLPVTTKPVDLVARYRVAGALLADGSGPAAFRWPISTFDTRRYEIPVRERRTWKLPAEVSSVGCAFQEYLDEPDRWCPHDDELATAGDTVTFQRTATDLGGPQHWIMIEIPADSVGVLEPLTDDSTLARGLAATGVAVGSVIIFPVLGWLLALIRVGAARDQRYQNVPPGVIGSNEQVGTAPLRGVVPVRFEPPDATLTEIGLVLDRGPKPLHLAATLTNLAVTGAVRLRSKPLAVWPEDAEKATSDFERSLVATIERYGKDGQLSNAAKQRLDGLLRSRSHRPDLLRKPPVFGLTTVIRLLGSVLLAVIGTIVTIATGSWVWLAVGFGGGALLWVGIGLRAWRHSPLVLTAKGSALADQAAGFREYLRTAESHELNFHADVDVYRRQLPWAVLFDEVERWTAACRELAAAGRIQPPAVDFLVGSQSLSSLGYELRGLSRSIAPSAFTGSGGSGGSGGGSSSFGGSGSSSGFSSSSSGGSGGGGTSASSW
ncbi:DUF2207 domain-containing protein [Microlunatus parietis]|uniref:TIGR04222 domain-containing protein n=1 Tax=Microlunatus parietis TaxID=682979 RepID=A0A7Y9LAN0_9ACTN|nr:DUF2207 domain-containing protein [Microlunatus parietis]NYE69765.1 hypothetical protein [Microlunatus parietis]